MCGAQMDALMGVSVPDLPGGGEISQHARFSCGVSRHARSLAG